MGLGCVDFRKVAAQAAASEVFKHMDQTRRIKHQDAVDLVNRFVVQDPTVLDWSTTESFIERQALARYAESLIGFITAQLAELVTDDLALLCQSQENDYFAGELLVSRQGLIYRRVGVGFAEFCKKPCKPLVGDAERLNAILDFQPSINKLADYANQLQLFGGVARATVSAK